MRIRMTWFAAVLSGAFIVICTGATRAAVIFSDFGPSDSFDANTTWVVSTASSGNGSFQAPAMGFTSPVDAIVTQIDIALENISGTNSGGTTIGLYTNDSGNLGPLLSSWTVGPLSDPIQTISGITGVQLTTGGSYFLKAQAAGDDWHAWYFNNQGVSGPTILGQNGAIHREDVLGAFRVLGLTPYLPTIVDTSGGGTIFQFSGISVAQGETVYIDPMFAIGYDFMVGVGDPNFASVTLPTGIGDNMFELLLWDGSAWQFEADVLGGVTFDFAAGGVDRFRILGIELSEMLDPNNALAFITGLTFVSNGTFNGTMTPITQSVEAVPLPGALPLFATGLGALGLLGWRRKRKRVAA